MGECDVPVRHSGLITVVQGGYEDRQIKTSSKIMGVAVLHPSTGDCACMTVNTVVRWLATRDKSKGSTRDVMVLTRMMP